MGKIWEHIESHSVDFELAWPEHIAGWHSSGQEVDKWQACPERSQNFLKIYFKNLID